MAEAARHRRLHHRRPLSPRPLLLLEQWLQRHFVLEQWLQRRRVERRWSHCWRVKRLKFPAKWLQRRLHPRRGKGRGAVGAAGVAAVHGGATLNPQPSTLNPQPSTLNPQPSTLHPKLETLNSKPSHTLTHSHTLNTLTLSHSYTLTLN